MNHKTNTHPQLNTDILNSMTDDAVSGHTDHPSIDPLLEKTDHRIAANTTIDNERLSRLTGTVDKKTGVSRRGVLAASVITGLALGSFGLGKIAPDADYLPEVPPTIPKPPETVMQPPKTTLPVEKPDLPFFIYPDGADVVTDNTTN